MHAGKPVHRTGSSAFLKVTNRIALKPTVLSTQIVTLGFMYVIRELKPPKKYCFLCLKLYLFVIIKIL